MSRFIRLYEKKRGERRTGSRAFGSAGEALFFGLFFVVGLVGFAVMIARYVWPEWRANRQFASTTCEVLDKDMLQRPATDTQPASFRPNILVRYQVNERDYEEGAYDVTDTYWPDEAAVDAILEQFEVGQEYPCWYDPIDPHRVVVVRGYSGWIYLTLLIPLSFMTIGGGALVYTILHWNASRERRALIVQQANHQLDLFEVDANGREFPTVPADANLRNSPGTHLAYRLPIATTTGWRLFAVSASCVAWNALVAIFVVMAVRRFARGEPDWMLVVFILPFLAGGLGLLAYLARLIMIATGVGPTRIEISNHPLAPGQRYEVFLSQAGRLSMRQLAVWLACDEQASYRQGTDTRTETRRVFEDRCYVREGFEVQQGLPFESRFQIVVPEVAMHSFQADHNVVSWKLIVKGSVDRWPDYERVFQIVVNPATNGHKHS